jgi:hypothetical protein
MLPILIYYYAQIAMGNTSPDIIKDYAVAESLMAGVDPAVITKVIERESGFDTNKVHKNDGKVGCNSRGLVQIRDCNHDVTDQQAFNPVFAVNFLIKNIDKCHTWWYNTCKGLNVARTGVYGLTGANQDGS